MAPSTTPPPTLTHVFNLTLLPKSPIDAGTTPRGSAAWIEVSGGAITNPEGEHVASVLPGSAGDYMTRYDGRDLPAAVFGAVVESVGEVDLRFLARADASGALFHFTASGFDYFPGRSAASESSHKEEPYGFEVLKCTTASEEYRWMNFAVLLARVRICLRPPHQGGQLERVEFTVYRVDR